jgi:hypothetical protein
VLVPGKAKNSLISSAARQRRPSSSGITPAALTVYFQKPGRIGVAAGVASATLAVQAKTEASSRRFMDHALSGRTWLNMGGMNGD